MTRWSREGRPAAVAFGVVVGMGLRTVRVRPSGVKGAAHRSRDGLAAAFDPGASATPSGSVCGQAGACPGSAQPLDNAVSWAA
jgi:hypothetical protein